MFWQQHTGQDCSISSAWLMHLHSVWSLKASLHHQECYCLRKEEKPNVFGGAECFFCFKMRWLQGEILLFLLPVWYHASVSHQTGSCSISQQGDRTLPWKSRKKPLDGQFLASLHDPWGESWSTNTQNKWIIQPIFIMLSWRWLIALPHTGFFALLLFRGQRCHKMNIFL